MAQNQATFHPIDKGAFLVRVNNQLVYQLGDEARAKQMVERLNRIFQDADRDLDFLTPTILQRGGDAGELFYGIICPLVRRNAGMTHFHPMGKRKTINRDIYAPPAWTDSDDPKKQTAVLELHSYDSPAPWVLALTIVNRIRRAILLNFPDAFERRKHPTRCYELNVPENRSSEVEQLLADKAYCAVYAHPCQGRGAGPLSPFCKELGFKPENILNPFTQYSEQEDQVEILHGCDLTCAITRSRGWYAKYKNRFLRVTNLANGKSVVVRVTDQAPRGRGVELTYAAWKAIGKPSEYNSVKVELMGS